MRRVPVSLMRRLPMPDSETSTPENAPQPNVGTDPMRAPSNEKERRIVAPDPKKVEQAERDPGEHESAGNG